MKTYKLDNNLKLKIKTVDGNIIIGPYEGFTQALDNEPEIASIELKRDGYNIELYENEIKFIEVI
ncbi:TPA: hypothetical protein I9Z60_001575 [Clostridium perfringens]|nr:hypothetical protein [Clostridium perfringens]